MSYAMDNRSAKGIALYTRRLIERLLERQSNDYFLVHYDKVDDPLYTKATEILMPKLRLPYGSRFFSQLMFFWKYRNDPFDIVHWFHPRVYPFFWLVPARKIFVTVHGAGDVTTRNNFVFSRSVFNFVLKNFHSHIDTIIVVSHNAKEEVVKYYGFPESKVKVIYNGGGEQYVALDRDTSRKLMAEKYGIQGPYILDISRLLPHKNVITLIRAYIEMRRQNPARLEKLVVVGGQMIAARTEYEAAEQSEFSKDIFFIDFVPLEDMNTLYSGAELFVFPSLSEGFGLPVLEAMASGTPVITSNVTSMPEIGGEAVITLDPLDVALLAREMNRVLSDGELRAKMIQSGLKRAKDFTWAKMTEETEKLYNTEIF